MSDKPLSAYIAEAEQNAPTNDPVSPGYVPVYEDEGREAERLERCLQQQIEDCFTTISRLRKITPGTRWDNLRGGLRCWRNAITYTRERSTHDAS